MAGGERVSVLIPAYNVERWVAAAIESALAQDHPDVEIVVVDDGSTDDTPAVLERYRGRVHLVTQANRGLAGARNTALAHATGDIVGLLDADDVWAPDRARRGVEYLAANPAVGFVTTDAWLIEGDGPADRAAAEAAGRGRFYGGWHDVAFACDDQVAAIARSNFVFVGVLARRVLFDRHGGFDEELRRAEDYDLWIRFLLGGERVGLIDEPLAGYRVRPDSLSANPAAQRDAHLAVLTKHLAALWAAGAHGRPGDAYDVARRLEARGDRRAAARAYLLGARDTRLGRSARAKQVAAAVRALVGPRRG